MVLIYDDGIQDNFAIYATGGGNNMNAMKFTPIGYPAIVKKFYVNIGTAANYPSGSNAFSPVQFAIYNEVGGLPGVVLSAPTTITPTVYGWTEANFTSAVTIPSGNFFIVMIQLGTSSASPGIAVDTTVQQLRSYSKFGNNNPWIPGPGNYMIRAVVNGSGGPLFLNGQSGVPITASAVPGLIYQYAPATVTGFEGSPKVYSEMGYNPDNLMGYQVWRLLQGQEATPALWTSVGTPAGTSIQDNSWPSLPCDPYRWGVKAQYTFNRWSNAIFSNAIGKCWTCNVTVNVDLSCDSANAAGAIVKLQNTDVVDTSYTYVYTATGTHTFTNVWKGHYTLTINKYGYTLYTQTNISIMGDMTLNAMLLEIKAPPTGLHIPDSTLLATWYPPSLQTMLLNEPFTSGSFTTNGWVVEAGTNIWVISAYDGNPTYCAEWYYYPLVANYTQSLTSKLITGVGSPALTLKYDIYLNNYIATSAEQLAVELWDGSTWHQLKNYVNSGSIAWKTETVDISAYTNISFKIRFRVYGEDSNNINYWDIDNVGVIAGSQTTGPNPCIFGYNFYLNGILVGYTQDTFYNIPPAVVTYGTFYHACVLAVYGSGYSTQSCYDFTSKYLCPPNTLTVTPIECNAYLSWKKPNCGGCTLKQYIYDDGTPEDGYQISNTQMGNYYPIPAYTSGVIKSVDMAFSSLSGTSAQSCIVYFYKPDQTTIFGQSVAFINNAATWPAWLWDNAACADIPFMGPFYAMVDYTATTPKNYFDISTNTVTGYPHGVGYIKQGTSWGLVSTTLLYDDPATFLERINVCEDSKDKDAPITTIDPSQLPPQNALPHLLGVTANSHTGPRPEGSNVVVDPPISPTAPTAGPVLLGYRVWRNNVMIDTINNPNHLEFYDYNLNPGTYAYKVDAMYSGTLPISPWHSQPDGPVSVSVSCGYKLPFTEEWTQANFGYQDWTFMPNQGNWSISTAVGDPTPCADFSWDPVVTNYSQSLVSPTIDATPWTCADIFCDFDVKLVDRNATGNEKLDIDVLKNGNWMNKLEIANNGSVDWTLKHVDISTVKGKAFMVRFRANGVNSSDILHWYVDNIHIYGECHPPQTLTGHQNQFTTTLTWTAPACGGGGPTPQWIHWDDGTNTNSIGTGAAVDFWIAARWDASQIVTLDGGSVTKINFWPASAGTATYRARIWEGPLPTNPVVDQAVPTVVTDSWNTVTLTTPHPIDISQELWIGMEVNATGGYPAGVDAGPAIDGYGDMMYYLGAWATLISLNPSLDYNWDIEAYVEPSKKEAGASSPIVVQIPVNNTKGQTLSVSGTRNTANNTSSNSGSGRILPESPLGSRLMGYNIYSTLDNQTTPFHLVNTSGPWSQSPYTDVHPNTTAGTTTWMYYVTAVFKDSLDLTKILCEPPSDTIMITFPAVGINDLTNNSLSLYPNPANDVVNVVSTNDIKTIEVLNYIGQTIYTNKDINLKSLQLNVTSFKAGVYFVKVTTVSGIKTTKITVTH
jgi:hypothetical protein